MAAASRRSAKSDCAATAGISSKKIAAASFPRMVLPAAGSPTTKRTSTASSSITHAFRESTSWPGRSTATSPLFPIPRWPLTAFVIARSKERTRKSAAAVLCTGLEKSERSRPDSLCGSLSETLDGAAKGSPWT
jgi:hypothetical protein